MAAIQQAQSLSELLVRVGGKLDLTITETSTPNVGQVCGWLNEAALLFARLLPVARLGSLRSPVVTEDDVGGTLDLTGTDITRVVGIKKYGTECVVLTQREMDFISTRSPLIHTVKNPSACVSGDSGSVLLQFWPSSPGPVSVKGVRKPTAYHNNYTSTDEFGDPIYDWAPDTYTLPVELETAAVDYAVIQGKVQDEEPEQVQILSQMWAQSIGIETKIPGIGAD